MPLYAELNKGREADHLGRIIAQPVFGEWPADALTEVLSNY